MFVVAHCSFPLSRLLFCDSFVQLLSSSRAMCLAYFHFGKDYSGAKFFNIVSILLSNAHMRIDCLEDFF